MVRRRQAHLWLSLALNTYVFRSAFHRFKLLSASLAVIQVEDFPFFGQLGGSSNWRISLLGHGEHLGGLRAKRKRDV
jgi:hypothetical protein